MSRRGDGFVAAGDEHAPVEAGGTAVDFHHAGHQVPVREGIIDSVMSLGDAVADIRNEIPRSAAAGGPDAFHDEVGELQQMGAARMGIAERALHQDLRFFQIFQGPAHSDLQRIVLRSQLPHPLAV